MKYTVEQIKKAKRFRVTNGSYFGPYTRINKWYELRPGTVCPAIHTDDSGWNTPHIQSDGRVSSLVGSAIAAGAIEYDIPDEKPALPNFFNVDISLDRDSFHPSSVSQYTVTIETDGAGYERVSGFLVETRKEMERNQELTRLERQRAELDAKIAELKGEAAE